MEMISLSGKTNFFEKRVSDYAKAGVMTRSKGEDGADAKEAGGGGLFSLDEEFWSHFNTSAYRDLSARLPVKIV